MALAARLGAQAVAEPRLDRALLLAREAVRLDDTADTRQALLATLLRSPALDGLVRAAGRDAALSRERLSRRANARCRRQRRRSPPLRHEHGCRGRRSAAEGVRLPADRVHAGRIEARRRRQPAERAGGARREDAQAAPSAATRRAVQSRQGRCRRASRCHRERRVLRVRPGHRPAGRRGPRLPRPARPRHGRPADGSSRRTRRRRRRARPRPARDGDEQADRDVGHADAEARRCGARPDPSRRLRGRRSDRQVRDRHRALRERDRFRRPPHRAGHSCDRRRLLRGCTRRRLLARRTDGGDGRLRRDDHAVEPEHGGRDRHVRRPFGGRERRGLLARRKDALRLEPGRHRAGVDA